MWTFVSTLGCLLDQSLTGCPKPGLLGPKDRLQGYAVLEKLNTNPHVHLLVHCETATDQFWTAIRLFELLDTVPWRRQDNEWQMDCWKTLTTKGWLTDAARTRKFSPLLHRLAPGATATVQIARTIPGHGNVFEYLTKELGDATLDLAYKSPYWGDKAQLHIRQLREFHSALGYKAPASRVRRGLTGALTLNLDDPNPWKRKGERIR
jgi:hypothetical protein